MHEFMQIYSGLIFGTVSFLALIGIFVYHKVTDIRAERIEQGKVSQLIAQDSRPTITEEMELEESEFTPVLS